MMKKQPDESDESLYCTSCDKCHALISLKENAKNKGLCDECIKNIN